jgi:hypothetical protein
MTNLSARIHAALWWLVPLVALALIVGWETRWGSAFERRPAPAEPIAPKPVVSSLLPEYGIVGGMGPGTEMVQRTLFNPTRRPAPVALEAGAGKLQRGQFALTGTLVIDGKSTAYLREIAGNKSRRVLAGDKINGMLVAEVKPDRVKLTLGDESEELLLRIGTNPRPTTPAAPVTAAAAAPAAPPPVAQIPAAQPGAPQEAAQTLAERRRAARAANEAAATAAATAAAPATAPPAAASQPTTATSTPPMDPRWNQIDKAYGARNANRGTAQ